MDFPYYRPFVRNWPFVGSPMVSSHKGQMMRKVFPCCRINSSTPMYSAAYMRRWSGSTLVQVMACRLYGAKPLPEPMLTYSRLDTYKQISVKFESKYKTFHSWKCTSNVRLRNGGHFCPERCVKSKRPPRQQAWLQSALVCGLFSTVRYYDCDLQWRLGANTRMESTREMPMFIIITPFWLVNPMFVYDLDLELDTWRHILCDNNIAMRS